VSTAADDILELLPADPHANRSLPTAAPKIANVPGRLGSDPYSRIMSAVGTPWNRRLSKAALLIPKIRDMESRFLTLNAEDLKTASITLRGRCRGATSLDPFIPEAFGLACAAIRRVLGYQPFDVQLAAGIVMHFGGLVELATGEGKTLCAIAPAYLNSLPGKGVHVTTVNDYLAKRDAEEMSPVYGVLGLNVGCLQQKMEDNVRQAAYKCDITYGTGSEFGFDFLRDRMKLRGGQASSSPFWSAWVGGGNNRQDPRVQRATLPLNYAIVDESDSIFIDEGRTPLVIANPTRPATEEEQVVYWWADRVVQGLVRDKHFMINLKKEKVELTDEGRQLVRYSNPPSGKHTHAMDKLIQHIEKGVMAYHRYIRDEHYIVGEEKKIVIVDERTGRPMPDRHWQDGQHQAIEAKEKVPITLQSEHAAQVTYMNFYRLYKKLGGMSGTLLPNFWELRKVYRRWVTKIPTNRPIKRIQFPDVVCPTEQAKFEAVVAQVQQMVSAGRAVLIGTRTVDKSEKLSQMLTEGGVEHRVLNARQDKQENEIVSQAGQPGRVTVATNMAGRGTDIKLGPGVAAAGGLHVIGTERHDAERVDRQLAGRAGRQGDPGSAQFFVCLEDQLLEGLGTKQKEALVAIGKKGGNRDWNQYLRLFQIAQKRLENKHRRQRLDLMNYDKHRQEQLSDLGADPYVD
jgi:preprotein translocase subunit SecA